MLLKAFTIVHVLISLVGIVAGFFVMGGMVSGAAINVWTPLFLVTTIATSVTGFLFPFERFLPSHLFGVISLVVLGVATYALYGAHLAFAWSWIYVLTVVFAQYLNFFVLVVQSFQKVPALNVLAPTQTEAPFKLTQAIFFVLFLGGGIVAGMNFAG
jgi:hypothetical protein